MAEVVVFIGTHKIGLSFLRECFSRSNCNYVGKPHKVYKEISYDQLVNSRKTFLRELSCFVGFNLIDCEKEIRVTSKHSFGYSLKEFKGLFAYLATNTKFLFPHIIRRKFKTLMLFIQGYFDQVKISPDLEKLSSYIERNKRD